MRLCPSYLALSCLLLLPSLATADASPMTAEKLWQVARISAPAVSPDGDRAVVAVTRFDIDENRGRSQLKLIDLETHSSRQITHGDSNNSAPVFSPDGRQLAFISRRGDKPAQIYLLPLDGGEARSITELPVGVSAPRWLPDGSGLVFAATITPGYGGDFEKLSEIRQQREDSKVTAKVTENRIYRHWDRWLTDGDYPRLFRVDLEDGKVTDLMPGSKRFFAMMGGPEYDISPDGKWIAVSANKTEPPYERLDYDIFLLATDDSGEMRNITEQNPSYDGNPVFAPDGQSLIYTAQASTDFYADKRVLVRYDLDRDEHTRLTDHLDISFGSVAFSDDGKALYSIAQMDGATGLHRLNLQDLSFNTLRARGSHSGLQLAGDRLLFTWDDLSNPAELFVADQHGHNAQAITGFNRDIRDKTDWGRVENVRYPGANGVEIQMYIIYPPDFDPDKQWPLLNLLHGGPHGIFGDQFHARWNAQLFSAPGYVTIMPNFHGSTSFGQDFAISIHGAHADLPFRDSQKAVDYMLEHHDYIDADRLAAAGGSYGGYLVSWIAGHTDRYAALINHAGVYNIMGQFASDVTDHRVAAYSGSPWDGLEHMNQWNPAMHAENFETPMLILHGELDYRVPITQGLEVYGVYKGKGLDARLVYYPDENHWILNPQNSIHWFGEFHDWLERFLGAGGQ